MAAVDYLEAFLAKAGEYFHDVRPLLPMYAHVTASAVFPIYVGAHASLSRPSSAAKPKKKAHGADGEQDEEEAVQKMEGLSNKDAIILPITAGIVLATLYFLIMRYGADMINLFMNVYFAFVGVFSTAQFVNDVVNVAVGVVFPTYFRYRGSVVRVSPSDRSLVGGNRNKTNSDKISKPAPWTSSRLPRWLLNRIWDIRQLLKQKFTVRAFVRKLLELNINMTIVNIFAAIVGVATTVYVNTVERTWILTNLQGFSVAYAALQLLSPTTFATGSLVLSALFFYDIWAVFFTPLMVGVATKLDQPIKLVFPKPDEPSEIPGEPPSKSYGMLGLGDIVVPGIMIGLALRFDLYLFYLKKQRKQKSVHRSASASSSQETVNKANYIPVTGHWGDRLWTAFLPAASLPTNLHTSFPKTYFKAAMIGYVTGLLVTLGVMHIFNHAQPALLYLVPGVLISLWGTGLVRGEGKQMWEFSEGIDASQVEQEATKGSDSKEAKEEEDTSMGIFEKAWHEFRNLWSSDKAGESKDTEGSRLASRRKSPDKSDRDKSPTKAVKDSSPSKPNVKAQDNLLFSFSVSLFEPKSALTAKRSRGDKAKADGSKELPVGAYDSPDDTIIVSSADLEGAETTSPSRYRTRSMGRVSRGRT